MPGGEALRRFLPHQRWFAAKDRDLAEIRPLAAATLRSSEGAWSLVIVEAVFDRGPSERYLLTLPGAGSSAGEEDVHDVAAEPALVRAVLGAMRSGHEQALPDGSRIRFAATEWLLRSALPAEAAIRPIGAEQSNSSVLIGGVGVLKFYRRLQRGVSPEIEMTRFLASRGYANTPPLLGTVELLDEQEPTGLGILTSWVANEGDAWSFALKHAARTIESGGRDPDAGTFPALAERLGQRTAELHRALCPSERVDAAFAPEPISAADLAAWRDRVRRDGEAMLAALGDWPSSERTRRLAQQGDVLRRRIDTLGRGAVTAMKTRFHGDYHLGQVLFTGSDFQIIDFEGEPRRTMAERRSKHSPLRDVAGMLRSFDYAAAAALRALPAERRSAAAAGARRWRDAAAASFLRGYRATIAGCPSYPADEDAARELLQLLLLEKAIYEVGYELANRPDWVDIPAAGILDLLDGDAASVD